MDGSTLHAPGRIAVRIGELEAPTLRWRRNVLRQGLFCTACRARWRRLARTGMQGVKTDSGQNAGPTACSWAFRPASTIAAHPTDVNGARHRSASKGVSEGLIGGGDILTATGVTVTSTMVQCCSSFQRRSSALKSDTVCIASLPAEANWSNCSMTSRRARPASAVLEGLTGSLAWPGHRAGVRRPRRAQQFQIRRRAPQQQADARAMLLRIRDSRRHDWTTSARSCTNTTAAIPPAPSASVLEASLAGSMCAGSRRS